ncbi:multicopper oxidase domain-containing protein [Cyanobium sp. FACHB-13342]|nr:multicopper oxidase domain-containing protein [Cyanobium sp. FACHB-13342]MBD2422061.1 multicopper oxidase domain-containing protein [Cyanobium sp. FACHB-13342]
MAGAGLLGAGLGARSRAMETPMASPAKSAPLPFDPQECLRSFEQGRLIAENGQRIRVFEVEARSITLPLGGEVLFKAWTLNGRVPGPTLRAQEGERIRVLFHNGDSTSHSLHFHGTHPAAMDGVEPVLKGRTAVYEFDLPRAGLYPYHCHVAPVARHVGKGLFGLLVVDPITPRPPADELVLVMGGYDLNNDGRNELYAFNGIPDAYMHQPIRIRQHQLVRLYLLNMTELEAPLTFHLHANEFRVIHPSWSDTTDVVTLGMAERQILEWSFPFTGRYMVHPHQDPIAERGCMGLFEVVPA